MWFVCKNFKVKSWVFFYSWFAMIYQNLNHMRLSILHFYNSIQLFIMLIGKTSILWIIYELHLPVPFPQDSDQLPSTSTHDQPAVDSIDDLQILKNFDLTLEYGPCTGKLQYYKLWFMQTNDLITILFLFFYF